MSKLADSIMISYDVLGEFIEMHLVVKSPVQLLYPTFVTVLPPGSSQEISYVSTTQMEVALAYVNSFQVWVSVDQVGSLYSTKRLAIFVAKLLDEITIWVQSTTLRSIIRVSKTVPSNLTFNVN